MSVGEGGGVLATCAAVLVCVAGVLSGCVGLEHPRVGRVDVKGMEESVHTRGLVQ